MDVSRPETKPSKGEEDDNSIFFSIAYLHDDLFLLRHYFPFPKFPNPLEPFINQRHYVPGADTWILMLLFLLPKKGQFCWQMI